MRLGLTSHVQTSVQSPVLERNTPYIAQNMVPTANATDATCGCGMRAVESAGQHPLVTKSLGAHTWGSGPRGPVCSPVRHQWDTSRT